MQWIVTAILGCLTMSAYAHSWFVHMNNDTDAELILEVAELSANHAAWYDQHPPANIKPHSTEHFGILVADYNAPAPQPELIYQVKKADKTDRCRLILDSDKSEFQWSCEKNLLKVTSVQTRLKNKWVLVDAQLG